MAKDRLNDLFLIFGYENGGFLAPCYPYFFDVDGYSDVAYGQLAEEQPDQKIVKLSSPYPERPRSWHHGHHRHLGSHLSRRRAGQWRATAPL